LFSLIYFGLYVFFALNDPDRLQTEKYQLEKFTQQLAVFSKRQSTIKNTTIKASNIDLPKIEDIETEVK
jgi:hypothetical protein